MASAIIPILSGLAGLGGIFGNQGQKQQQESRSNTQTDSTGSSQPVYDPLALSLRDSLLDYYRRGMDEDTDLSGYKAQGIAQIQSAGQARTSAIKNSLASRGLSYSPVAAIAPSISEGQRIGDIASFSNSIPLLARQLRLQNLDSAGGFLKGLPVGSQTSSEQKGGQSGVNYGSSSGNPVGGGLASAATTAAGLYGRIYGGK